MRTRLWVVVMVAAAAVSSLGLSQRPASAQAHDPAAGEALFLEGRRLMKAGDRIGACAKFAESLRLDPAVGTLANLADCEEQVGRTASAWQHWRQAADQMPPGDPRRATAAARAAALEKRLARLTVRLAPDAPTTTTVTRDGVALGAASFGLALPTDPGAHQVVASAPGRGDKRYDVILAPEEKWELMVEPGPPLPPSTAPPLLPVSAEGAAGSGVDLRAAPAGSGPRWQRPLAYGLLAAGAASVGAGGYFGWRALRARETAKRRCAATASGDAPACWSTARGALDRDRKFSLLADIGVATGAAAAGAGIFFLLRGRSAPAGQRVDLLASPLPGGGEVQLVGGF